MKAKNLKPKENTVPRLTSNNNYSVIQTLSFVTATLVIAGILFFLPLSAGFANPTVTKVIDGDSFMLSDGREIRLIGVDCPEFTDNERNLKNARFFKVDPVRYSAHAEISKEFLQSLVDGKQVRTEIDPLNEISHHHDTYGRFLAYVYLDDDTFLNAALIQKGVCAAYKRFSFRHKEAFIQYEEEAREAGLGIWAQTA